MGTLGDDEPAMRLAAVHSLQQITGMNFRGGAGPEAPVSADEIQSWQNWWSTRRVGTSSE